jgi:hypothetical protein
MEKIKKLKLLDLVFQVLAIGLPWLYYLLFPGTLRYWHLDHLVTSYSVICTAQMGSAMFNRSFLPAQFRAKSRNWFESIVLMLVSMAVIATLMKALLLFLLILFYIVPMISLWYLGIVVAELIKLFKADSDAIKGV